MIESFKLPNITPETLTGSICSFNDEYGGLPLKSCTSLISGYQEGSGVPSPSNVRPLHAFSSANIGSVSDYASYFQGLYQGTYGFVDLGSLEWTLTERYFRADLPITPKTVNDRETPNAITDSQYQPIDFYSLYNNYDSYDDVFSITNGTAGSNKFYLRDTSYNDTIAFKTAMSGVYLIYELATPTTPTITPEQFATLCQAFGITGNTYTFTFGQSIYQGSIDWKRGVVVGSWLRDTFNGSASEAWEIRSDGTTSRRFNLLLDHSVPLEYVANYLHWSDTAVGEWGTYNIRGANNDNLAVKDNQNQFATVEAFKTYLSSNPLQLAYELATPIEIPLGGINLLTQEGVNNIFCDTGDTTLEWLKVN